VLTADQKGAIAETAIVHAAIKFGVAVYRPVISGAALAGELARGFATAYTASEVDGIAAYCADLDRCFYVPAERFDGHPELLLRVAPCRNSQRLGINWAEDFDFES
jgi:hypothetical protein